MMRHMKCAKKRSDFYNGYNEDGEFRLAVFFKINNSATYFKQIMNKRNVL